jgi:hypothetical protein
MIPFEEIDSRLQTLGKDRTWLAENTPYSADYIRTVLAPNSKRKTERVQQVLSDAIEKEERGQSLPLGQPPNPPDRITIEVDSARMDKYCEAAAYARQDLKSWAIHELNRAAEAWLEEKHRPKMSIVAEEYSPKPAQKQEEA